MTVRQTTIVDSAILPKQMGIIPGLDVIAWCEDGNGRSDKFCVYLELKGSEYCLFLEVDGNPQNNIPENLSWGDYFDNWNDKKRHGRGYEGGKHPRSKLTDFERKAIKWIVKNNIASIRHIARMLDMNHSTIIHICNNGKKYHA